MKKTPTTAEISSIIRVAVVFLSLAGAIGGAIGGAWSVAVARGKDQAERDELRHRVDKLEDRLIYLFGKQ